MPRRGSEGKGLFCGVRRGSPAVSLSLSLSFPWGRMGHEGLMKQGGRLAEREKGGREVQVLGQRLSGFHALFLSQGPLWRGEASGPKGLQADLVGLKDSPSLFPPAPFPRALSTSEWPLLAPPCLSPGGGGLEPEVVLTGRWTWRSLASSSSHKRAWEGPSLLISSEGRIPGIPGDLPHQ